MRVHKVHMSIGERSTLDILKHFSKRCPEMLEKALALIPYYVNLRERSFFITEVEQDGYDEDISGYQLLMGTMQYVC